MSPVPTPRLARRWAGRVLRGSGSDGRDDGERAAGDGVAGERTAEDGTGGDRTAGDPSRPDGTGVHDESPESGNPYTVPGSDARAHRTARGDGRGQAGTHHEDPAAPPTFARRSDGRMVAGVAVGLAAQLKVQPLTVRIMFSLLSAVSGFGIVLYLALWIFTPLDQTVQREADDASPAGVAAATRSGKRRRGRLAQRTGDLGQLAALVLLGGGVWLLVQQTPLGISPGLFFPLLLAAAGLTMVWRTADEQERQRLSVLSPSVPWLAAVTGGGGWLAAMRILAGVSVVVAGVVVFLVGQGQLDATVDALGGFIVVLVGIGLITGPWLWRMWRNLESERRARIVSQERADMASHLHDSVLQTLALIQKQAHDPRAVVRLARSQERDLRSWLYSDLVDDGSSLAAALTKTAAEVEDAFGVPVEVVTVGDAEIDDAARAILKAAREATVNAAKHSGADKVDIFVEAGEDGVELFVRDRGAGFDPDSIPDDRMGVRRSIIDRMQRHGGEATFRSAPGEGTEVRLSTRSSS
ncbi:phage shock protein C (PspC) family protein [Haloactinopolyspora alba]|uniref:Phage shock protein C (PspC) family protein n=1 Tax=Haloactinopolyspora alba TaxID=648780 RepID=A0A2P8E193_9ACTN|nr:ATP-binding protein [Haloactinopolyspora alba]PSL03238.1 phage shock protein C (PspC) family protein [Haloactinopolyspora alba]